MCYNWSRMIKEVIQIDDNNVKIILDNEISYIFDINYVLQINFHGGSSMSNNQNYYEEYDGYYPYYVHYYECINNEGLVRHEIGFLKKKLAENFFNYIVNKKLKLEVSDKIYLKVSSLLNSKQLYLYSIIYDYDNVPIYKNVMNELYYMPEFGHGYFESLNNFKSLTN